ncbi:MAG: ABC transporter substrate-binding protein [Alteraurantiacibacter sp.]|nr:ABC transporter substrate-binding protein [Alteraurantiacibacter sp.]
MNGRRSALSRLAVLIAGTVVAALASATAWLLVQAEQGYQPKTAALPAKRMTKPQAIVSLNLCTDILLMQLVAQERIAAVTRLAANPYVSPLAVQASHLPQISGTAEEVVASRADLVLAGRFSTRQSVALLKRLGYQVVEFAPETSLDDALANIRKAALAVGEEERGKELVGEILQALAALPPPPSAPRPVLADYGANGFTSGHDTLLADLANRAGFVTLGQHLGFSGQRQVSPEQVLASGPRVIAQDAEIGKPALAHAASRHPALARLLDAERIALDPRDTACGNTFSLKTLALLSATRQKVG